MKMIPYSVRSFKHNYKHQLYSEDIRKLDFRKLKPVDVLVGGFHVRHFLLLVIKKDLKTQEVIFFLIFVELLLNYQKCPELLCLKMLKILEDMMEAKQQKL